VCSDGSIKTGLISIAVSAAGKSSSASLEQTEKSSAGASKSFAHFFSPDRFGRSLDIQENQRQNRLHQQRTRHSQRIFRQPRQSR